MTAAAAARQIRQVGAREYRTESQNTRRVGITERLASTRDEVPHLSPHEPPQPASGTPHIRRYLEPSERLMTHVDRGWWVALIRRCDPRSRLQLDPEATLEAAVDAGRA